MNTELSLENVINETHLIHAQSEVGTLKTIKEKLGLLLKKSLFTLPSSLLGFARMDD